MKNGRRLWVLAIERLSDTDDIVARVEITLKNNEKVVITPCTRNSVPSFTGFSVHHDKKGDGIIAVYDGGEHLALHGSQQAYERFLAVVDSSPLIDECLVEKVDPFFRAIIDKWTK